MIITDIPTVHRIMGVIHKAHREWKEPFPPAEGFTEYMRNEFGIIYHLDRTFQVSRDMVEEIEIVDQQKYLAFMLRYE